MKKKYLAAILGVMIATTSVTACGVATTETTTNTAESSENKETEVQMWIKRILMRKM